MHIKPIPLHCQQSYIVFLKVDIMAQFFTEDMIYDTNYSPDEHWGNSSGIEDWFYNEHIPWNLAFDNATFTQVEMMIFASCASDFNENDDGDDNWNDHLMISL